MKAHQDMGQLFDWISVPLSLVGAWPLSKTYFRFTGWIVYYSVYLIGAYADLASVFGDLELMVLNFVETGLQNMIVVRLLVFRFSKILPILIDAAKKDMRDENWENDEERQIYFHYYSSAMTFFKTFVGCSCCTTVMYSSRPIQEYFVYGLPNGTNMIMPAYHMRVFVDLDNVRNVVLVHIFQMPLMAGAIFHVTSICLLVALVFNVCGQLSVLSYRIVTLNPSESDDANSVFRKFVTQHLRVIWMAKSIENVFQMLLLNELVGTTVVLGLIAYSSLTTLDNAEGAALATFGSYTLSMIILVYANCLVGEHLNIESERLRDAFYQCNWLELPKSYRKALLICIRAQVPLQLTAGGFYPFTHESFTDIIKKSGAYVSMLRTMTMQ
nr:olfactory receptor 52 [Gregopimpla kuwanae]